MAKCLILGADGFIGSHLAEELSGRGHHVRAFDRFKDNKPKMLPENLENVEIVAGDFLNRYDLAMAIKGMEYVFHFISTTTPATSGHDPLLDVETNIRMSVELFELCRKQNIKRVIYPSTGGAIYGRDQVAAFKEADLATPMSPYAIGKLAIEGYLGYYDHAYELDYLALRISNPYGERQNIVGSQGVIPIFLNLMQQGQAVTIYGDGSSVRDYIYIKDLVRMIANIFDKPTKHKLYNIGSGQACSLKEIIEAMSRVSSIEAKVNYQKERPTDIQSVHLDVSRYADEFGAPEFTSFEEGLTKTLDYIKSISSHREAVR